MFTGVEGLESKVTKLGGTVVTAVRDATHLVADSLMRTSKFLCAMSVVPHFVASAWVEDSAKAGKWLPEARYPIPVTQKERDMNLSLSKCLASRNLGAPFLTGVPVTCTRGLEAAVVSTLKEVTDHGGGEWVELPKRPPAPAGLIVISAPSDMQSNKALLESLGVVAHDKELLIRGALLQNLERGNHILPAGAAPAPPPRRR